MKRRIIFCWILGSFLLTLLYSKESDYNKDTFIESINHNRQYILEKVNDSLIYPKRWLSKYNDMFKEEIPTDLNSHKKYEILNSICYIGRRVSTPNNLDLKKHQGFSSLFIEDERLFRICIHAFKDKYFSVKNLAREILITYGREDYLAKYSNEIKKFIPEYYKAEVESRIKKLKKSLKKEPSKYINETKMVEESIKENEKLLKENYKEIEYRARFDRLYLLLPMLQKEKKYLLDTVNIRALEYRARFGDKKAEKKLIRRFKEENDFRKKSSLAKKLGIAGTEECAKVLIRALYSPLNDKRKFNSPNVSGSFYTTIRVPIISSLLRMHPNADFKYDFSFVIEKAFRENRVELYGGRKKVLELFNNIVTWAEKKYNVKPIGTPPDLSEPILINPGIRKSH